MGTSELSTRTLSAIVLAAAVLFITWWDERSFALLCFLGGLILAREWWGMSRPRSTAFFFFGLAYIAAGCVGLVYLRLANLNILWSIFAIVWAGDIAAYLVGRRYGHHKIAPRISPGKSWEGLAASVIVSAAVGATLGRVAPVPHAFIGAALAVIGLMGDMFESHTKRRAGLKDSGTIIPGHGGLFDRVDALIPCAIFAGLALYIRLHSQ